MMLDTTGGLFPEGKNRFKIVAVPEQGQTDSGHDYFKFHFKADVDGEERKYSERFMVWLMGPICQALGFPETKPGFFDFEPTKCLNRWVVATIVHEEAEKGKNKGKVFARMRDILPGEEAPKEEIPF